MARTLPEGQKMWIAFADSYEEVTIVARGSGDIVFKTGMKPKCPYLVVDCDGQEYVVGYDHLHHTPREASIEMAQLAREAAGGRTSNPAGPGDEDPDDEDEDSPDSSSGDEDEDDEDTDEE